MLPNSVFENLTRARNLRIEQRSSERRSSIRVAVRAVASAYRIQHSTVGTPVPIRVRDISTTGISFITQHDIRFPGEFLIRIQSALANRNGSGAYWIWCQYRRRDECDRTCALTSASFLKILSPGNILSPGTNLNAVNWMDIEGDVTPSDLPFRAVA